MWEEYEEDLSDEEQFDDDDSDYDEEDDDDVDDDGNIEVNLPMPHAGQQQIIRSKARFKILCCGRRWGKSLVSQIIAINSILQGEAVAYITPEFSLGKDFFREVISRLPQALVKFKNISDLHIELISGGSLRFLSGQNLESFRGRKFNKVIIDEAAFINDLEAAWYGSIRPTFSDLKGSAIFISTPRGMNFFYALFQKGLNKEKNYESFHFKTSDNPYFPKGEYEEARL